MDARILCEADLQKLVHCEVLKVEQGLVDDAIGFGFVFRSLDETIFQLYFVPGVEILQVAGQTQVKPNMAFITKEVFPAGGN